VSLHKISSLHHTNELSSLVQQTQFVSVTRYY